MKNKNSPLDHQKTDLNQLAGSLASEVKLSNQELKQAKKKFEKEWARKS